jgi:hypothetical protein
LLKKETDQTKREKWKNSLKFWVEKDDETPKRPTLFFLKNEPTAFAKRIVDAVNNSILMGKPVEEMKEKPNESLSPSSLVFVKVLVRNYKNLSLFSYSLFQV